MMYILTISECYPSIEKPQEGIYIKQQIEELKKIGNQVDVLIPDRNGKHKELYFSEELGDNRYCVSYKANRYDLFLERYAKECYLQIKRHIEKKRYDLIAIHITGDAILKIVVHIANELAIPVVVHYHGLNVWNDYVARHPYRQKVYAIRREKILNRVTALVGVSEKVQAIIKQRIKSIPVYTVYNGVDLKLFEMESHKCKTPLSIVAIGNLIPTKGFRYLIEAFARLHTEMPNIHLDILGDGPEKGELMQKVCELKLEHAVCFHGKLEYVQVAEYLKRGYMFVLPSYYEALGCVYLEAMACGLPVIGVCGMGIDEIINDGVNGFLVRQKNSDELFEKMRLLLEKPELAIHIGEQAKATMKEYSWKNSAEKLNEIYLKCIKR